MSCAQTLEVVLQAKSQSVLFFYFSSAANYMLLSLVQSNYVMVIGFPNCICSTCLSQFATSKILF